MPSHEPSSSTLPRRAYAQHPACNLRSVCWHALYRLGITGRIQPNTETLHGCLHGFLSWCTETLHGLYSESVPSFCLGFLCWPYTVRARSLVSMGFCARTQDPRGPPALLVVSPGASLHRSVWTLRCEWRKKSWVRCKSARPPALTTRCKPAPKRGPGCNSAPKLCVQLCTKA